MKTIEELEARLAKPSNELVEDIASIDGDIMLLGVAMMGWSAGNQSVLSRKINTQIGV